MKHEMQLTIQKLKPDGTDELVHIEDIIIPKDFIKCPPRKSKINKAIMFLQEHRMIDVPISVLPETNERGLPNRLVLFDEYTRLIALLKLGYREVPVKYI
jgi:hypothetical protein